MGEKTILICDDDESVLETLCLVLRHFGFIVITENMSANIFTKLAFKKSDLLLVDLRMPFLTGRLSNHK
jgi:FixJ family two-component response regulator